MARRVLDYVFAGLLAVVVGSGLSCLYLLVRAAL